MWMRYGLMWMILAGLFCVPLTAKTWYVRPDGGTRFSGNMPSGQCDGSADSAYSGSGSNRHCAFNDFRFMWDDKSGRVGSGAWVIAGGDTILIRGCKAAATQTNPSGNACRIGWDSPYGTGANLWCYGVGSYTCFNPPIPAGTASQHTRILGQNYAACNAEGATNPKLYNRNLTELFGGFSLAYTFNLQDTQYVDVQCIALTTHNGRCTVAGIPAYPRHCSTNQPLDDYAQNGFVLNNKSAQITLQDVSIHGFNSSGLDGPIGGAVSLKRVFSGFNAFSGWNFDDGRNTPNAPGSRITASYVTMIGNGCYEEYPVRHDFPGQACYDSQSGGFGDAWSGQDTDLDEFVCDHCVMAYNTKDAFLGPHTNIRTLTITNSESHGNMGAQWKWNNTPGATVTFVNNITVGDCLRMKEALPGAPQGYDAATGRGGSYLSNYCRAGGNTVAINSQQNSHVLFANNTFVNYVDTGFLLSCGPQGHDANGMCGSTQFAFTNNIFLGYGLSGGEPPGLFYVNDPSIKISSSHNIEYGNRPGTGDACRGDILCVDPRLSNQPSVQRLSPTSLDNFNFYPASGSPAIGRGVPLAGVTMDHFGRMRPNPPAIGAVEP